MLTNQNTHAGLQESKPQEIIIHGTPVRLKFAAEQNAKGPAIGRDILKSGWLRRRTA